MAIALEVMSEKRRLAAIMFTDIVGYTALMGSDEDRALEILRTSRKIQKKQIESHGGKWLKEMGDGVLAQFDSAKDSVYCALAIQHHAHAELEAQIRIGIHLGDVTAENEDVFGDGVNIASRVQSIADPGGIYISESVDKAIRSQADIKTLYLGEISLKNVDYPVRTFALQAAYLPAPSVKRIKKLRRNKSQSRLTITFLLLLVSAFIIWIVIKSKYQGLDPIRSLAVLPFDNMTGDAGQAVLVAGMHEALISELGQISKLRVISKTSMMKYRETTLSAAEIASELGVDALIETSLLEADSLVNINVKLIGGFPNEDQMWSNTFSRDFTHIVEIYREVTQKIIGEIEIELPRQEEERLAEKKVVNPQAYAAYLNARSYWGNLSKEGLEKALEYYQLAVDIDPLYAPAYGGIASVWAGWQQMGFASREEAEPQIRVHLQKALELDSTLAEVYYYQGLTKAWTYWDWAGASEAFEKALAINSNFAEAHAYYSHLLMILKKPKQMRYHMDQANILDPYNPLLKVLEGAELANLGQSDQAIESVIDLEILAPTNPLIQIVLWMSYHMKGDTSEAFIKQRRILELVSDSIVVEAFENTNRISGYYAALSAAADQWASQAGTNFVPPDNMFWMYAASGDIEKTMHWLEIGYDTHDSSMPYVGVFPLLDILDGDPRYDDLLRRLELP